VLHGGVGWTASLPADVSHLSILPAAVRQSYYLGVYAQRAGRTEEEGLHSRTVWEQHSPSLYLTAGSPVPSRRLDRRLWTAVSAVPVQSSAVPVPRAADSTPCIPAARPMTPVDTPVRPGAPHTPAGNTCFKCGEAGHYANACPKRHPPGTPVQN
jgi:hypothetical protein